jgi:hypothetical protein
MHSSDHHYTLNGGESWLWRYSTLKGGADGWTDYERHKVLIHQGLTGKKRLEIEIHEGLHATLGPAISEECVTQAARDLAKVLHSLGYRLLPPDKKSG